MDPLLEVLRHTAELLGGAALTEGAKRAFGAGWDAVKQLLHRPHMPHDATRLLGNLQQAPIGPAAQQTLEQLSALRITEDPATKAVLEALSRLLERQQPLLQIENLKGIAVSYGPVDMTLN